MGEGILEGEKDPGKMQFQQELNRLFESRGVMADLRSHLRHLMISALQNTRMGTKTTDGSSPKAQALNLIVAEYLLKHGCHYTLSVLTSEVPTLANFSLDEPLQGNKPGKKRPPKNYFQETEVEDIFNALGLSSGLEQLTLLKTRYLESGKEVSLVELFIQMTLELATKVHIQRNLESHVTEGERILSKEWSSKVADVLLGEKMPPSQISAVEEIIFRITENEMKRIVEEQRRSQLEVLSMREKRIQEYLKKHEEDIFCRLMEAEKELTTRKDIIEEELLERENHLTKMAVEWNNKHEDILRMSKKFHNIERENRSLKKELQGLGEENRKLKAEEESQRRTIVDLREEMRCLMSKLKEVTESNAILSDRLQVLIAKETTEDLLREGGANQATTQPTVEIPLLWSRNTGVVSARKEDSGHQKEPTAKKPAVPHPDLWNVTEPAKVIPGDDSSEDEEDVSFSSSFGDIIQGVQEKLQVLEEESNRLNQSYLEYKLKCISVESDSESLNNPSTESPSPPQTSVTEVKFCQTSVADDTLIKIQKLKESKETKYELEALSACQKGQLSPRKGTVPTPTKRQLQNREFFLKSRYLVQQLEKEKIHASLSLADTSTSTSGEDVTTSASSKETKRKSSMTSPAGEKPQRKDNKPPGEGGRTVLVEIQPKSDAECLALLEEARIKTPQQLSARRPLRQQMLLSESEREEADEEKKGGGGGGGEEEEGRRDAVSKSVVTSSSPRSNSSGKVSVGGKTGSDGYW